MSSLAAAMLAMHFQEGPFGGADMREYRGEYRTENPQTPRDDDINPWDFYINGFLCSEYFTLVVVVAFVFQIPSSCF